MAEKWLYSIRNMHLLKERPEGIEGTELEELYDEAHYAAWPAEKRMYYERYIMNRNDIENIICEHYEEGLAVGREEGREEGRSQTIRQLLESGMSMELIAKALNLTQEERQMFQDDTSR